MVLIFSVISVWFFLRFVLLPALCRNTERATVWYCFFRGLYRVFATSATSSSGQPSSLSFFANFFSISSGDINSNSTSLFFPPPEVVTSSSSESPPPPPWPLYFFLVLLFLLSLPCVPPPDFPPA